MKTLKLRMVIAMITFTMAGLTSASKIRTHLKDRLYLTFENAVRCHDLIIALYQQIQPDFAQKRQNNYLAAVVIEETQYVIIGSYEQWKTFYSMKWDYLLNDCPVVISMN
jgi:hypothetical protein